MSLNLGSVTFDANDVLALSDFWAKVLNRSPGDMHSEETTVLPPDGDDGPPFMFHAVPEGKAAKNRVHIDFMADDRPAEVARLVGLGATEVGEHSIGSFTWTVLQDPEGNEFCVAAPPG